MKKSFENEEKNKNIMSDESDEDMPEEINFSKAVVKEKLLRKTNPVQVKKIQKKKAKIDLKDLLDDTEDKQMLEEPKRVIINKQAKTFNVMGKKKVQLGKGFSRSNISRILKFKKEASSKYDRLRKKIN